MSLSKVGAGLLLACSFVLLSGCSPINRIRAKSELNESARAYKEGKFKEAEAHARKSIEFDPNQKNAPSFLARTIHAQYRQGLDSEENKAKAREAIEAYKKILEQNPNNNEAFQAVGFLYGALGEVDKQEQWITSRANDQTVEPANRAEAYVFLASKQWQCSQTITDAKENKVTANKDGKVVIVYKKPKEQAEFDKAMQCTLKGLEYTNQAINLNPNNEKAWGYKTNLLLERKKLAEMDGKTEEAANFGKEADTAQAKTTQLNEQRKQEEEAKRAAEEQKKKK